MTEDIDILCGVPNVIINIASVQLQKAYFCFSFLFFFYFRSGAVWLCL